MTRRLRREWWGCRPEGGSTFFRCERKYQRKHAARRLLRPAPLCVIRKYRRSGHCRARRSGLPVANCLRQLCPLGTRFLSAQASVCGSRTVGRPEFIRGVQFRPLGRNSLTTFRGQTALRGCPRARGVRCRIAPCRSLCSPPTLPAGRFGLRPRPHWGHASLRDSSLRSPAGKKPFTAHF